MGQANNVAAMPTMAVPLMPHPQLNQCVVGPVTMLQGTAVPAMLQTQMHVGPTMAPTGLVFQAMGGGAFAPTALQALMPQVQVVQAPAPVPEPVPAPDGRANVVAAAESLYYDQLKPYGRILRKRLAELSAGGTTEIDTQVLKATCEACPCLQVQEEEGGDWSVLLIGRPPDFVDVYNPLDIYPPELWHAATAYFDGLSDADMKLPGGRYSCAKTLAGRGLSFLQGRSLGQVSHIVQLAISQKKVLGYLNGAVVPYSRSQSMVKDRCAERQRPCASRVRGATTLVSWSTMRKCLQEILMRLAPASGGYIPLSNMKRLFRSRFRLELSETALGHAKLSELLQDNQLRDVCEVRLQGHSYVVFPLAPQLRGCGEEICLAGSLSQSDAAETVARAGAIQSGSSATTAPIVGTSRVSLRERAKWIAPLSMEDIIGKTPLSSPCRASSPCLEKALPSASSPHGQTTAEANERWAACSSVVSTPGSAELRGKSLLSLPRLLGRVANLGSKARDVGGPCKEEGCTHVSSSNSLRQQRQLAPFSPSAIVPSLLPPPPQQAFEREKERRSGLLTPGRLGDMGLSVHNTFIHVSLPLPTPLAGARCRSHSLPGDKCLGRGWRTPAASAAWARS